MFVLGSSEKEQSILLDDDGGDDYDVSIQDLQCTLAYSYLLSSFVFIVKLWFLKWLIGRPWKET